MLSRSLVYLPSLPELRASDCEPGRQFAADADPAAGEVAAATADGAARPETAARAAGYHRQTGRAREGETLQQQPQLDRGC